MKPGNKKFHRYYLASFFILTFLIAWSVWIPAGIFAPGNVILVLPGAWAPTIAALLLTGIAKGKRGLSTLLRSLIMWRVRPIYYLFAIFSVLGIATLSVGLHVLLGGPSPDFGAIAGRFGMPEEQIILFIIFSPIIFITTIFVGGPIAEELGWRGYAQPLLQNHFNPGLAGLIIGFVWSLWHLPLFLYFPSAVGGLPLEYYIPLVSAMGIVFAWLYNRTRGSVFLCILLHAGTNFAIGVVGTEILITDYQLLSIFVFLMGVLSLVLYFKIRSDELIRK